MLGAVDSGTYIDDGYKANAYIYSVVSAIADKASSPTGNVYRNGEIVKDHEFVKLLDAPNDMHTGKTFREEFYGYCLITGNAFMHATKSSDGKRVIELWNVPSPCVEIKFGTRLQRVKGYKISYIKERLIRADEMAHMTYFNPQSGEDINADSLMGLSPMKAIAGVIQQSQDSEVAQGTLFKNMHPSGILTGDGNDEFDEEEARSIQDRFRQYHTGVHKGGDIIVTPAKVSWQNIGISPVDLQLIEADDNFLQKIAAVYKYPKELIAGDESYANSVVADAQLITKAVLPVISRFDACMTKFIRTVYKDKTLEYKTDLGYFTELSANKKEQTDWLNRAWWYTVNEKRKESGLLPLKGMDIVMVPSNFLPYDDLENIFDDRKKGIADDEVTRKSD